MLARLFSRRRPATRSGLPAPAPIAPYAVPPHAWQAARVVRLTDEQAADYAGGDELMRAQILLDVATLRTSGPVCQLCGEDWHPAVALMPCRR